MVGERNEDRSVRGSGRRSLLKRVVRAVRSWFRDEEEERRRVRLYREEDSLTGYHVKRHYPPRPDPGSAKGSSG